VTGAATYECVGGPLDGNVLTPPGEGPRAVIVVRGHDNACLVVYLPVPLGAEAVRYVLPGPIIGGYVLGASPRGAIRKAVWQPLP
jgi:hypothetical protein